MFKFFKKNIVISILLGSVLLISACELPKSDDEIIEEKIQSLISAFEDEDKVGIKSLFAKSKVENINDFDKNIDELLEYYDGVFQSKRNWGKGVDRDKEGDFQAKWFNLSYDVTTEINVYRIAIYCCTEYTTDSDSVGIWSLYILKCEDDCSLESAYGGDGLWTPGINIGKVYTPDES